MYIQKSYNYILALLIYGCHDIPLAFGQMQMFKPVSLELLSTEVMNYDCSDCAHRDPYLPEHDNKWKYGVTHTTKIDLISTQDFNLNFDTKFFLDGVSQVENAGLIYEWGFRYKYVELGRYHMSRHAMDIEPEIKNKFPITDAYVVRFNWVKGGK